MKWEHLVLTVLYYTDNSTLQCESATSLQTTLDLLQEFCTSWSLEVYTDKTKVVVFGKQPDPPVSFTYASTVLEVVTSFNVLGVTVSSDNKWSAAADKLYVSLRKSYLYCLNGCKGLTLTLLISISFMNVS